MSIYRHVHINFWQDAFILDLTPEEKYFYVYLLTNSKTKQCGIYELPSRIIETETGYNRETVDKLLARFEEYGKIVYDKATKEIYIKNWTKHNKITSVKVKKCVEKELAKVKSKHLIKDFLEEALRCGYELNYTTYNLKDSNNQIIQNNNTELSKEANTNDKNIGSINTKAEVEDTLKEYVKLYEQNVGPINEMVKEWIVDLQPQIDLNTFKKAISIATDKGKCNKAYINGILNQWINKSKTKEENREDEYLYSKPTTEQLEQVRKLLEGV